MVKIFIDPGHGGVDGGAGRAPYLEKELVLTLSTRLRNYLQNNFENVSIAMSRSADATLSLSDRTTAANRWGADFLISIHFNAFNGVARGYEDFVYSTIAAGSRTENIRIAIHNEVVSRVLNKYGIPNRGRKKANFHMVRESNMPAVLVETLFVDNAADQRLIANANFINDIVAAYGEGIARGMNLRRKAAPVSAPAPTAPTTGTLYRVQCGAFSNRRNAEALEARLKRSGYPAFITSSNGLFRVQCGAFSSRENAERLESNLRKDGFPVYIYRG